MTARQKICAVLVWSTSAYTCGRAAIETLTFLPDGINYGLGGLITTFLLIEAGRRR